jgi:hypothetical protein
LPVSVILHMLKRMLIRNSLAVSKTSWTT